MKTRLKLCALGLAVLMPTIAAAGKPSATAEAGCAVLPPAEIYRGQPYTIKVVRVPSYPGGWSRPEVTVEVTYPITAGNGHTDSSTQEIFKHNVTYTLTTFTVPDSDALEVSKQATVAATVREPLGKKRFREAICTATTTVY